MTLDQLRMLIKIADTGSVLAAAESLNRTQPTISVGIRKLEEELGVDLLARDQYRAYLTPAGEKICQQAREVLHESRILVDMAGHLASGHEAKLRIAIEESCPIILVLDVLKKLEKKYPLTEFELVGECLWGALEKLEQHDADLAITPWTGENAQLQSFPLLKVRMIPVASPDLFSGSARHTFRIAELETKAQVIVRDSSREPRGKNLGVLDNGRRWLVNDHATKREIILAGMGWGRLQQHLIQTELESGHLVELHIEDFDVATEIEIRVARRSNEFVGSVAAELWNALKQKSF